MRLFKVLPYKSMNLRRFKDVMGFFFELCKTQNVRQKPEMLYLHIVCKKIKAIKASLRDKLSFYICISLSV